MNFQDLYNKIKALDENTEIQDVEECGMMPLPSEHGQSDSVTMNISMNGSGSGGIRDLMNILRNIDNVGEPQGHHGDSSADDLLFGIEEEGEEFGNAPTGAPGQNVMPISAVLPTGDDLASKGEERPKVNGGGNPMQENLKQHLTNLYQQIKESGK